MRGVRSRRQKEPVRVLHEEETRGWRRSARSTREPASHVRRATQLLAVAAGQSDTEAARMTGRRSGDAVAQGVRRFNREGVQARARWGGAGTRATYGAAERETILAEARRCPGSDSDGTATWSLSLLQQALRRQAPQSLGQVSTYTIWAV
jgi:hypothetical protein